MLLQVVYAGVSTWSIMNNHKGLKRILKLVLVEAKNFCGVEISFANLCSKCKICIPQNSSLVNCGIILCMESWIIP